MRTRFFTALVVPLILWGLVAAAQPPGVAGAPVDEAMKQIRAEAIRAHIRFLADDLLEGRGTGTRGHELAATAAKHTQLNFLVGYQVAEQTQPPTWNPGDFFSEKFGGNRKP